MLEIDKSKFKAAGGQHIVKGLFYETTPHYSDKSGCVYTLKNEDHMGFPSLYRLYMEVADPTEYRFFTQYLDGLDHWEKLLGCNWFEPYISAWRKELTLKIKSEALAKMIDVSKAGGRDASSAARFLVENGWVEKDKKGRPSKQDIKDAAHKIAENHVQVNDDYERLTNVSRN